jgi:acyl-CoA thioesterase-2
MPVVPAAEVLEQTSWTDTFDRAVVPADTVGLGPRDGAGRALSWMKVNEDLGDRDDPAAQLLHRSWLAYLSDDMPTDAVMRAHPVASLIHNDNDADNDATETGTGDPDDAPVPRFFAASLDHAIWFHHPLRADRWHLHDFSCHHFVGGRGLALGHVFSADGLHVATVAQEVLVRDRHAR